MKQGGIFSQQLLAVYVDNLSNLLLNSKIAAVLKILITLFMQMISVYSHQSPAAYKGYLLCVNNLDDLTVLLLIH